MTEDWPAVDDHLRFALDAADTGLWEWDRDTDTLRWDETAERLFGYDPGSFPGTYEAFTDRILSDDRDGVDEQIATTVETGERYDVEFRIERPDGEHRWIRSRGVVTAETDGEPTTLSGTHEDVTDQRTRQRELESYRQLFESTTDCIVEIELVGDESRITRVNAAFEAVFGYTEAEVRGEDIHDLLTPEEEKEDAMQVKRAYEEGEQPVVEVTRNTADGQREFLMRAVNFSDQYYYVSYTDITDRKESERAIEQGRAELRQIVDLVPDPLYAKNRDDEVLLSNEANAELHGMTPEGIEGEREREFISDVENIENYEKYRRREIEVMETGDPMVFEEELTGADGEEHVFQTTRIPFEAAGTAEDAILGYARDVTALKAYEQELEEQRDNLDVLNKMVRHDIRNNLQVVAAYADMVRTDGSDEIEQHVEKLLGAVQEAIDITTTAREVTEVMLQSDVERQTVPLATVLASEADTARSNHDRAQVTIDGSLPAVTVVADDMLASVFRNLLNNAIQHNDTDGPEVTVSATRDDDTAVVRIADNGPGIPDGRKAQIFEQGEMGLDSEGTGLGLYLVDTLVDRYDGSVHVEDNEPAGAVFVVELRTGDDG